MARAYVGVDVGGTSAKVAMVMDDGSIVQRRRFSTGRQLSLANFLEEITRETESLKEEAHRCNCTIEGVGFGIPGLVTPMGKILSVVNLPALSGQDLASLLENSLALPVKVLNDATAAAYGEFVYGAGRFYDSLLLMTLGTGVGGGIVLNRNLWMGADGAAGEVGHLTVEPDGRPCSCGNRGCLEQYASASAIGDAWLKLNRSGDAAELTLAEAARHAAEAAGKGDLQARAIFEDAGRYLGIVAADIANLLNLEAIILGGGLIGSLSLFKDALLRELHQRAFAVSADRLKVVPCELGDDAGVLGAVAYLRRSTQSS